jgi:uncharacterized protein YcgI (DUF1989 family)
MRELVAMFRIVVVEGDQMNHLIFFSFEFIRNKFRKLK